MNRIVFKFPTVLLLQQEWYFSETLWSLFFFQLYKWMFFTVHFIIMKNCFLSNIESYLFFMKIKYFQFCNVIRHTSSLQNCNKYEFHFSKVRASLSISHPWIQSHFLCTIRQLQKQRVLDYEIILKKPFSCKEDLQMIYFELAFDKLGNPMKCCYCNCCHYHDGVSQYSTNRVDKEFANPWTWKCYLSCNLNTAICYM